MVTQERENTHTKKKKMIFPLKKKKGYGVIL